jgi:hypothetical protein
MGGSSKRGTPRGVALDLSNKNRRDNQRGPSYQKESSDREESKDFRERMIEYKFQYAMVPR